MAGSKQRKFYFTVTVLLCLVYTFHISLKSFIQFDTVTCSNSNPPHVQVSAVIRSSQNENESNNLSTGQKSIVEDAKFPQLIRTDYFGCYDFDKLPQTVQSRKENNIGNRGISFIKVKIDGLIIPAVYKEAHRWL